MKTQFEALLSKMNELKDLSGVIGLASWDQETCLPPLAASARAHQLSTLQSVYHQKLTQDSLKEALDAVLSDDAATAERKALGRVLSRERNRAVRVPEAWVKKWALAQSLGLAAWHAARKNNDFKAFAPVLDTLLKLRREQTDFLGFQENRYDALLDHFEPGMTVSRLAPVLSGLSEKLLPLVEPLAEASSRVPDVFSGKSFNKESQWKFCQTLLSDMGFDFRGGRLDKSTHPFTGGTHPLDVRLTTRVNEDNPLPALFGAIHEGGHGLYEQGFAEAHHRTSLAEAPSMGLHESQSRLWENAVGRSFEFWSHYFPLLRDVFPEALKGCSLELFYNAVNRVQRTLIRVEADKVTYNLHIVLRFELELALLSQDISVNDLPSAWNEKMEKMLGVRPRNDLEGVLQDIHWAYGELGYFPTYALGNLYSATLFQTAQQQLPNLPLLISQGQLLPLKHWLRRNIHEEGHRYSAEELVRKVSGRGLNDDDFVDYLRQKYSVLRD